MDDDYRNTKYCPKLSDLKEKRKKSKKQFYRNILAQKTCTRIFQITDHAISNSSLRHITENAPIVE